MGALQCVCVHGGLAILKKKRELATFLADTHGTTHKPYRVPGTADFVTLSLRRTRSCDKLGTKSITTIFHFFTPSL